jgi:hypothetical protein
MVDPLRVERLKTGTERRKSQSHSFRAEFFALPTRVHRSLICKARFEESLISQRTAGPSPVRRFA